MTRTFWWDAISSVCPRTSTTFLTCDHLCKCSPSHINSTEDLPPQQGARLLQHTCTETVAPRADCSCFESGLCEMPAVPLIRLCWLPANFLTRCHTFGLPCLVLNICSTISLYFLFFSSPPHSYHPSSPSLQSISSPNLEIPCCELDGDAGGM